jgi:prepilin-type N-terminal cleavage/methylation domain-containing protein
MVFHDPRSAPAIRQGYTLLEMMVVVALVGILTGLVAISWKRITYKIKVLGAVEELRNAVQLARSDAVTKRRNSGLLLDVPARRYLRFIDSSNAPVSSNGRFDSGEVVTQDWTDLPAQMLLLSVSSSLSPGPGAPAVRITGSPGNSNNAKRTVFDRFSTGWKCLGNARCKVGRGVLSPGHLQVERISAHRADPTGEVR